MRTRINHSTKPARRAIATRVLRVRHVTLKNLSFASLTLVMYWRPPGSQITCDRIAVYTHSHILHTAYVNTIVRMCLYMFLDRRNSDVRQKLTHTNNIQERCRGFSLVETITGPILLIFFSNPTTLKPYPHKVHDHKTLH